MYLCILWCNIQFCNSFLRPGSLSDWTLNIENGLRQAVAYFEFAKAFDSLYHNKLLAKMKPYGICGPLLEWIGDFLTGRTQQTRVGKALSDINVIISGVIQSSCLGPVFSFCALMIW